ncbi:MAG: NTP/NDP exchange transporter [Puniceicoccales bacterium]|jgi:AAA family ATP:ADP antiporter|nr:NTP/NDP exchange transporter [Puniceicoccales bacterium]
MEGEISDRKKWLPFTHLYELKKIVPLGMILFIFIFNFHCLKNIKDTLVVTGIGAEALPFIKLFFMPLAALLAVFVYTKASDIWGQQTFFCMMVGTFLLFFGIFALWLYPHRDWLHPDPEMIQRWQEMYPLLRWPLGLLGQWIYILFLVFSELWGGILLLFFWQFANQTTSMMEAKRLYPLLSLVGQSSVIFSGFFGWKASDTLGKVPLGQDPWYASLCTITSLVLALGLVAIGCFYWFYRYVLVDMRLYNKSYAPGALNPRRPRMGLWKSLKLAVASRHIGMIALLVLCCEISIVLIEGLWKDQIRYLCTGENAYNTFKNGYTIWMGVGSILTLVASGYIHRRFQWQVGALVTPFLLIIGGGAFFACLLWNNGGQNPCSVHTVVWLGVAVLVVVKSSKIAFFDLTKEMAYIPLDEDKKVKGKAVVDVFGGRISESLGAGIQVFLLMAATCYLGESATYKHIAPYCLAIFLLISGLWIFAVRHLSRSMRGKENKRDC